MGGQIELFKSEEQIAIAGLSCIQDFVSVGEERELMAEIERGAWSHEFARRRQHYGVAYGERDYNTPTPLPAWIEKIARRIVEGGWFSKMPVQALVNEYNPGQGISAHKDYEPFDEVASLSLASGCLMEFAQGKTGDVKTLWLEPRSLLVLTGEARHEWTHAIRPRQNDLVHGVKVARQRRLSLTLRTV
jgi:alkylated DNA repair dioxygenase AlkB